MSLQHSLKDFFERRIYVGNAASIFHHCHSQAVAAGWWHDLKTGEKLKKPVDLMIALCHSEISEALEADRKNLKDDKLTHRDGFEVEIADLFIRLADMIPSIDETFLDLVANAMINYPQCDYLPGGKRYTYVCDLHGHLSKIRAENPDYYGESRYRLECFAWEIAYTIKLIVEIGLELKLDLAGAVYEKLEFNRQRADHKPEARLALNGKQY